MNIKTFQFGIVILFLSISSTLFAADRPKIGLVLSGGGARGGAHVGVIRFLEEKHIPIDAIVGTSMGSLVGGLYASGMSVDAIEKLLISTDWQRHITYNEDRSLISNRMKESERNFSSDLKVGVNEENDIVLGPGLFKRHEMLSFIKQQLPNSLSGDDFNTLRIPFCAIATDLATGNKAVLSSGSLAESIYASLSIPGGFEPIVIDGKTLVDGGVADNLPVDVMREMGVDIILVVDISSAYDKSRDFHSYFSVMGQLSDILVRKNVEQSIASLKENEILITPELNGFSSLDADKYAQIIPKGYEVMQKIYKDKLKNLSLDQQRYAEYKNSIVPKEINQTPIISKIVLENHTYLNDKRIYSMLHIKAEDKLDIKQLNQDIKTLYNMMIFDDVVYNVVTHDHTTDLHIKLTPKWDINGEIKFAFGFEDDFKGHSDYSARLQYTKKGINSYGGEWRSEAAIGIEKLLYTEFYQPLDVSELIYFRPELFYRDKKVYVTPSIIGSHSIKSDIDESMMVQALEYGGAASFGVNITNSIQLETSLLLKTVQPSIDYLLYTSTSEDYVSYSKKQHIIQSDTKLGIDTLDNPFFPTSGVLASFCYKHQLPSIGSDNKYSQALAKFSWANSYERHTLLLKGKYGTTFNAENFDQTQDFNAYFTLGGLFNLSGLPTNALTGDQMVFGSLNYRYRLTKKDFFGDLSVPLYLGSSLERGRVWYHYYDLSLDQEKWMNAASVYLGAQTVLGPFFIAVGTTDGKYFNTYLTLGRSF